MLVPATAIQTVVSATVGWGPVIGAAANFGMIAALVFALAAMTVAVGQSYSINNISVGWSYRRAVRHSVPLVLVALAFWLLWMGVQGALLVADRAGGTSMSLPATVAVAAVLFPTFVVLAVHMVTAVQAATIEGLPAPAAIGRSVHLVGGNAFRLLAASLVLLAAAIGVGIVLMLPVMAAMAIVGVDAVGGGFPLPVELVVAAANAALAPPVVGIGLSLVYYDLRVRKEGFDYEMLST
ncbi:MAG: hypothetical protein FJ319_05060 [SAR202 cluster bacterium]|nr:hypothetical protein [SAR202 cluster bacterium]